MPSSKEAITVNAPVDEVWNLVKDFNNIAPLMPGYTSHEVLNDSEAAWEFLGDFGIVKKKINVKIDNIVRIAPHSITFDLKGTNENVEGEGKFEIEAADAGTSRLTGFMDLTGGGFMGGMINSVLKTFIPESTKKIVDGIGERTESAVK